MRASMITACLALSLVVPALASPDWDDAMAVALTTKPVSTTRTDKQLPKLPQTSELSDRLQGLEGLGSRLDRRSTQPGLQRDSKLLILINAAVPTGQGGCHSPHP